jgi:hypothetical protein
VDVLWVAPNHPSGTTTVTARSTKLGCEKDLASLPCIL